MVPGHLARLVRPARAEPAFAHFAGRDLLGRPKSGWFTFFRLGLAGAYRGGQFRGSATTPQGRRVTVLQMLELLASIDLHPAEAPI